MRWIDRVDFLDEDASTDSSHDLPPGLCQLSRWTCSTIGFEVGNFISSYGTRRQICLFEGCCIFVLLPDMDLMLLQLCLEEGCVGR